MKLRTFAWRMHWLLASTSGVVILAQASAVSAQAAPQTQPTQIADGDNGGSSNSGDIVVTARKTAEKLSDIPLSVSAVTGREMIEKGIHSLADIADFTPGFRYTDFLTRFNGNPTIRGLAADNPQAAVQNVGVFLDGIYLQRGYMLDSQLNDIARVEVVKGPQSALYGQNTFSGAVNYVLNMPTNELKIDMDGSLGSAGYNELHLGVGGPIIKDMLMARIYYARSDYSGTWTNNFPGLEGTDMAHFGGYQRSNLSGSVLFKPINELTVRFTYNRTKRHDYIAPFYAIDGNNPEDKNNCGAIAPNGSPYLFCGNLPTNPAAKRSGLDTSYYPSGLFTTLQPGMIAETQVYHAAATYKLNPDLTLSYDYGNVHGSAIEESVLSSNSYMMSPGSTATNHHQREAGDLHYDSNEVKLTYDHGGPFKIDGGAFRSIANDSYILGTENLAIGAPAYLTSSDPLTNDVSIPIENQQSRYTTTSGYLRASLALLDKRLILAAEGRYTDTKIRTIDLYALTLPPLEATFNDFTPRATISFKVDPAAMIYASAARGAKAGGFNGYTDVGIALDKNNQSYGEEKNWTYELGVKGDTIDHRLSYQLDVFYVDWQDRQVPSYPDGIVPAINEEIASIYTTGGTARSLGIEFSGNMHITHEFSANVALTYQNATIGKSKNDSLVAASECDNIVCNANGDTSGNQLPYQPKLTVAGGLEYRRTVRDDIQGFVGIDEIYRGHTFVNDINTTGTAAYALTNARIGVDKGPWEALIWVKNAFNKAYVDAAYTEPTGLSLQANLGELRTWGATVSFHY